MPRLTKIYTKVGDRGSTKLGDGSDVTKSDARVEAYGAVDEANACLGVAAAEAARDGSGGASAMRALLVRIQNDLFDVGADLCVPLAEGEAEGAALRITAAQVEWLERRIDEENAKLSPLENFVLPGGTALSAALHLARTVTRRAERRAVALLEADAARTSRTAQVYLNRLSDLLFVLARAANSAAGGDVLWTPGANREGPA